MLQMSKKVQLPCFVSVKNVLLQHQKIYENTCKYQKCTKKEVHIFNMSGISMKGLNNKECKLTVGVTDYTI